MQACFFAFLRVAALVGATEQEIKDSYKNLALKWHLNEQAEKDNSVTTEVVYKQFRNTGLGSCCSVFGHTLLILCSVIQQVAISASFSSVVLVLKKLNISFADDQGLDLVKQCNMSINLIFMFMYIWRTFITIYYSLCGRNSENFLQHTKS